MFPILRKFAFTYFPGILLFLFALLMGLLTYKDYGMSWDEPMQRLIGVDNYNYILHGDRHLFTLENKEYGAGFEIPLIFIEKAMKITDVRDVYLMRHFVTHLFFLVSVFFGYVLIYRLFENQFLACLGFFMLAFAPRIYAHSFFNTKDIPFLSMMIICFTMCQIAFEEKKAWLFLLLGVVCGYATGIRVMGAMLDAIILFFLYVDMPAGKVSKIARKKAIWNIALFVTGCCIMVLISWPYLWQSPVVRFFKASKKMAHFIWNSKVLMNGEFLPSRHLPWSYFPIWFAITNPLLWFIAGLGGMVWLLIDIRNRPLKFLQNTTERNFLIYLLCFTGPIFAVVFLHSVIYDDWRHLYFVYPSFVLMALYMVNKFTGMKYRYIVWAACLVQVADVSYFMISSHPVQQVYFNSLVPHKKEYLRKNYDFDYWGVCYMQALNHLVAIQPQGTIKLCLGPGAEPTKNNIMMLPEKDRRRVQITEENQADYFITNFRWHPEDFPNPVEYSVVVLNSTAVCVFKTH